MTVVCRHVNGGERGAINLARQHTVISGLGARSRESLPKPGQSMCSVSLAPTVANLWRIFKIISFLRRGGNDRMSSASGVMGRCITTLGNVCAKRSLSRMGWLYV